MSDGVALVVFYLWERPGMDAQQPPSFSFPFYFQTFRTPLCSETTLRRFSPAQYDGCRFKKGALSLSYSARQSLCRLFLLQSPTFSLRIQSREGNNTVIVDWQPCRRLHQFLVSKLNLFCYFLLLQTQRFSQSVYVLRDVIMGIASHYGRCRHTQSIIGNGTLRIFYTSES